VYLSENDINLIKQFMLEKLSPFLIIIFGTAGRDEMRPDSDIDIAYLSDQHFAPYELFLLSQELARKLNREVDLIDLATVSTVFQAQIVGTGRVIYCRNEYQRMIFNLTVLKKYARLNEERRPIIEKIKERGSVYAK
jgi:predicted nucleotidyltransferase